MIAAPPGIAVGETAFRVHHALAGHPAFALERLVALAARLPADEVEWNPGALPIGHDPARTPRNGLGPEETVRRIASCGSWLVLKNVQREPELARLLAACLDAAGATRRRDPRAFVFVSSPGAVTPYHLDPEQNFLLQIAGEKRIFIADPADRVALPEEELERFVCGGHRNLPWHPRIAARATAFVLRPGDGVHVPVTAPHWVENGPEPSISFSVTFRTAETEAREAALKVNARLRRLGLSPRPVGGSRLADRAKWLAFEAARRAARATR